MERKIELGNMKVRDVRKLLIENPSIVEEDASIETVLKKMIEDPRTRHVYVRNKEGVLTGSVRMNTVVKYLFPFAAVAEAGSNLLQEGFLSFKAETVHGVMNPYPCFVKETTSLAEMAKILMKEKINELPVIDDEKHIIGQINIYEVIDTYLKSPLKNKRKRK